MRPLTVATVATVAVLLAAPSVGAQGGRAAAAPAYRRAPNDTVRLREVSTSEAVLRGPQGEIPITTRHDAVVAVAFLRGDSARAWYEQLTVEATGPQGTQRPESGPALRQPFTLRFDARGRVETLATPEFPESFRGITDLRHQFADFFLRLPASPLRAGLVWSDTVQRRDSTATTGQWMRSRSAMRYRVVGDTTVDGVRGVIIALHQDVRIEAGGPVPGQQGMTAESLLEGPDDGIFVFSPGAGRILGRHRTGELAGTLTFTTPQGPMSMKQTVRYTNTLSPVGR